MCTGGKATAPTQPGSSARLLSPAPHLVVGFNMLHQNRQVLNPLARLVVCFLHPRTGGFGLSADHKNKVNTRGTCANAVAMAPGSFSPTGVKPVEGRACSATNMVYIFPGEPALQSERENSTIPPFSCSFWPVLERRPRQPVSWRSTGSWGVSARSSAHAFLSVD